MIDKKFLDRFNQKYTINPITDCWIWTGAVRVKKWGYGGFNYNGTTWLAHRFSYLIHRGEPGKMLVCHKCDNPKCVNPNHLFLGTQQDNVKDMIAKDRHGRGGGRLKGYEGLKGSTNPSVKLTEDNVREIKRIGKIGPLGSQKQGNTKELAKRFNVSTMTIANIIRGKSWTHIK